MQNSFDIEIGGYLLTLPARAQISAKVTSRTNHPLDVVSTHWTIALGRFQMRIHVRSNLEGLAGLKRFIDYTTRSDVEVEHISINGIQSVKYGGYELPRTCIDWWFREGNLTLCVKLQSVEFPHTPPTKNEITEHNEIIASIRASKKS